MKKEENLVQQVNLPPDKRPYFLKILKKYVRKSMETASIKFLFFEN